MKLKFLILFTFLGCILTFKAFRGVNAMKPAANKSSQISYPKNFILVYKNDFLSVSEADAYEKKMKREGFVTETEQMIYGGPYCVNVYVHK